MPRPFVHPTVVPFFRSPRERTFFLPRAGVFEAVFFLALSVSVSLNSAACIESAYARSLHQPRSFFMARWRNRCARNKMCFYRSAHAQVRARVAEFPLPSKARTIVIIIAATNFLPYICIKSDSVVTSKRPTLKI